MSLTVSSAFANEQTKFGTEPIWLAEIPALGIFLSSREPQFTGNWKAGDGLVAGSPVKAGDPYPVYENLLTQLDSGGLNTISFTQDALGFSRTGNTAFEVLNQGIFSDTFLTPLTEGTVVRIRLGFFGLELNEYLTVFKGVVEEMDATLESMTFSLIDDTLSLLEPTPSVTSARVFPRSFEKNRAIPIALGEAESIPSVRLVGDVSARLGANLTIGATDLFVDGTDHPFPPTGDLIINGAETLSYGAVTESTFNGRPALQFTDLTRTAPLAASLGETVVLTNVVYTWANGFIDDNNDKPRVAGAEPTTGNFSSRAVSPTGDDPRTVFTYESTTDLAENPVTDMAGGVGPNLVTAGSGSTTDLAQWTIVNGTWSVGGLTDNFFQGSVPALDPAPGEMYIEFPVEPLTEYYIKLSAHLTAGAFYNVFVGFGGQPAVYFSSGNRNNATEEFIEGTFTTFLAPGIARITLQLDNASGATARFDHIRVRKLSTLNPSNLIRHLIEAHIPSLDVHDASFNEAFTLMAEEGDVMSGALVAPEEAQAVIGRIAYQFRCKTHLGEDGEQRLVYFDNQRNPVARIGPSDIDKGSMHVELAPEETVYSQFFVYYDRDYAAGETRGLGGRENYRNLASTSPTGSTSDQGPLLVPFCQFARDTLKSTRALEVFADFITDPGTANRLMEHLVRYHTYRKVLATFTTWINRIDLEIGDFIFLDHELLPDFASGARYEIIEKSIQPNGFTVTYKCQEIRQTQFGGWIETWEPFNIVVPAIVLNEVWDLPPDPVPAIVSDDDDPLAAFPAGTILPCSSFIETWGGGIPLVNEDFSVLASADNFGNEPNEMTQHLAFVTDWDEEDAGALPTQLYGSHILAIPGATPGVHSPLIDTTGADASRVATGGPGGSAYVTFQGATGEDVKEPLFGTRLLSFLDTDATITTWVRIRGDIGVNVAQMIISNFTWAAAESTRYCPYAIWYDGGINRLRATFNVSEPNTQNRTMAELRSFLGGQAVTANTFGAVPFNTWLFVAFRFDFSTLTVSLSVNGGASNSLVVGAPTTTIHALQESTFDAFSNIATYGHPSLFQERSTQFGGLRVGLFKFVDGTTTGPHLNGDIAQTVFYGRHLSDAELLTLYNSGSGIAYPFV